MTDLFDTNEQTISIFETKVKVTYPFVILPQIFVIGLFEKLLPRKSNICIKEDTSNCDLNKIRVTPLDHLTYQTRGLKSNLLIVHF